MWFIISSMMGVAMAVEKPWADWPDSDIEAGLWVKEQKIYEGYSDGLFHPSGEVTPLHFITVMRRAGIEAEWPTTIPATIGDALKYLPNTVTTSKPTDKLTRFRLAVMLYRHFVAPINTDQQIIDKLDMWFKETKVTWNGVTRQPRLIGHAAEIVRMARFHNIPIWLALGQCWRESQWGTTGLSIEYNCLWGMKDTLCKWGMPGNPRLIKGYTNYISIDTCIDAYFKLMSSPDKPYRALIDQYLATGDMTYISKALDIYAPGYENDTIQHHKIVRIVKDWCDERGIK